jgi:hypothetical protein
MNEKLTKWAAADWPAAPALGGSVTRPGDTIGAPLGMPIPPGLYFASTATGERRDTSPQRTCVGVVGIKVVISS